MVTGAAGSPTSRWSALVVDDEVPLARVVAGYLARDGFYVEVAHEGEQAVELARTTRPDIVVLDLMLPGIDGIEVCRRLRTFSDAYVLMLTARTDEVDKLVGLSVGADDYVTKPFSPRELVARVRAMLRRPRHDADQDEPPVRRFGELAVDVAAREVHLGSQRVELTRTEFDVLATLASRPRLAFTRRHLVEAVWGNGWVGDEHVVDVHVRHLRLKLGDEASDPRYIRTVRGVGYRMGGG